MKSWVTNNFGIKLLALLLAIVTWFYMNTELKKQKRLAGRFYNSALFKSTLADESQEQGPSQEENKETKSIENK